MVRAEPEVLKAIEILKGNPHWETFAKWIRESWGQVVLEQKAFSADLARYPYNSGRSMELSEILNTIDKAGKK